MILKFVSDTRGYSVSVGRDLLGDLVLERRWYGLHNRRGGRMAQIFSDEESAEKVIKRIMATRTRNGYRIV